MNDLLFYDDVLGVCFRANKDEIQKVIDRLETLKEETQDESTSIKIDTKLDWYAIYMSLCD